jgi:hypothetical protein
MATSTTHPIPPLPRARFQINPLLLHAWTVPLRWKSLRHPFVWGALFGLAIAVGFDRMMRHYEVMQWRYVLLAIGFIASWWPAWRAMAVCLNHRQKATWVHWLMTPLTPRQLFHGLWLDAAAPALVMLGVAWPLMALSWHRHGPILAWVFEGALPDFGLGATGIMLFFFGATLGLITLASLTNTLLAVVIALRFRSLTAMVTAMLVTLLLIWPGLLGALWFTWFETGWEWVPRSQQSLGAVADFDWPNLIRIAAIHWAVKGIVCLVAYVRATRNFQAWCLGER